PWGGCARGRSTRPYALPPMRPCAPGYGRFGAPRRPGGEENAARWARVQRRLLRGLLRAPVARGGRPVCCVSVWPGLGALFSITIVGMVRYFSPLPPQLPATG